MITSTREGTPYSTTIVFRHPDSYWTLAEVKVWLRMDGLYGVEVNHGTTGATSARLARLRAAAVLLASIEADEIADGLEKHGYGVMR